MDGITDSMDMSLSKLREIMKDREAQSAVVQGITKNQTRLSPRTTPRRSQGQGARDFNLSQKRL